MIRKKLCVVLALCVAGVLSQSSQGQDGTGPYPADITAWTEQTKDQQREAGKRLMADLEKAIQQGHKSFNIPKGDYRFASVVNPQSSRWYQTHVNIRNANGLTIDGGGSTFWFETGAIGISMTACRDTVLKNLNLDWDPLPYTQGKIVSVDAKTNQVEFSIAPGYEKVTPEFAKLVNSEAVARGSRLRFQVMDDQGRFKRGQVGMRGDPFWQQRTPEGTYKTKLSPFQAGSIKDFAVEPGDSFIALYRDTHGMVLSKCDNVTVEDVTLYAAPFVGIFEAASDRRVTYRRCRIVPRPGTNRLLGGNADGIQITNSRQGPLIEECEIRSIGDDFLNSHGYYYRVLAQESPTSIIVDAMGYRDEVSGSVHLSFLSRPDWKDLGERNATVSHLSYTFGQPNDLLKTATNWGAGGLNKLPEAGQKINAHRLTLDEPITLPPDSILACDDFCSPGTIIRNNTMKNSLAVGIRMQAPDTLIENNHIEWTANAAIRLLTQPGFWGESTHPDRTVVRGNTVVSPLVFRSSPKGQDYAVSVTCPGDLKNARWIKDVTMSNNVVRDVSATAMRVMGVKNVVMENNRVEGFGQAPLANAPKEGFYAFSLEHVIGLKMSGNQATGGGVSAAEKPELVSDVKP